MSNPLLFSASALGQQLVNDQIGRRTNAALVAFLYQTSEDNARMQSPSISDVNVWRAQETVRDERLIPITGLQQMARDAVRGLAAVRALQVGASTWFRYWLGTRWSQRQA